MATKAQQKNKAGATPRIVNKRATFDYTIEERFEAGLVLRGWEASAPDARRSILPTSTSATASSFSAMRT